MSKHIFTLQINNASSTEYGTVKVVDDLNSTLDSTTATAASPKSVKETNDKIDNVSNNLNVLENTVSSNTTSISELSSSTQASISSINTNISTINTDILEVQNKVNTNTSSITSLTNKDTELSTSIINLQEQVNKLDEESDTHLVNTGGTINGSLIVTGDVTVEGTINANIEGTSSSAIQATKDSDGNIIVDTYATLDNLNTVNNSVNTLSTKLTNNYYDKSSVDTIHSNITTSIDVINTTISTLDTTYAPISHVTSSGNKIVPIAGKDGGYGHVMLTDSPDVTYGYSSGYAATPKAVNTVYKALQNKLDISGGTIEGDLTVTGSINATISGMAELANKDSSGNVIVDTYATKEELNAIDVSDKLHKVASTGSYNDLENIPSLYTQEEVNALLNNKVDTITILDSNNIIKSSVLPSYVDDVEEYSSFNNLPTTGEGSKIYITTDNNRTYRWSGTTYVEIASSLALGITSGTAYEGSSGKVLEENISTIEQDIASYKTTVSSIYATKEEVTSSVSTINTSIDNTNTELTNTKNNLSTNYYTKEEVDTTVSNLNTELSTSISNVSTKLENNYYSKDEIDNTVSSINTTINNVSTNLSDNYYTKESIDNTVNNVTTSINKNAEDISTLSNTLTNDYYTSSTIDTTVSNINISISNVSGKVDSIIEENTKNSSVVTLSNGAIDLSLGKVFYLEVLEDTTFTINNVEEEYSEFVLFTKNANSYNIDFSNNVVTHCAFNPVYSYGVDVFRFITIDKGLSWFIKQDGQYLG